METNLLQKALAYRILYEITVNKIEVLLQQEKDKIDRQSTKIK